MEAKTDKESLNELMVKYFVPPLTGQYMQWTQTIMIFIFLIALFVFVLYWYVYVNYSDYQNRISVITNAYLFGKNPQLEFEQYIKNAQENSLDAAVNNIQSNASEAKSHGQFSHPELPSAAGHSPSHQGPRNEVQRQHQARFQVKSPVAFAAQVLFLEVRIHASAEGFGEVGGVPAVANCRYLHSRKLRAKAGDRVRQSHRMHTEFFTLPKRRLGLRNLPNAQAFGRHFQVLVVVDELHEFLERELFRRRDAQPLVSS